MSEYKYTIDMAVGFKEIARSVFEKFIGKPAHHLEIGVYEGLSGCIMLDEILAHPRSRYIGIDPYEEAHHHALQTARENFERHKPKVTIIPDFSASVLPCLLEQDHKFETIYIDGCHSYQGCRLDIEQCWSMLCNGGVILCDDYDRDDYGVKQAVDEFLTGLDPNTYKITYRDYKIAWAKL